MQLFDVISWNGIVVCSRITKQQAEQKIENEIRGGRAWGLEVREHRPIENNFDPFLNDIEDD